LSTNITQQVPAQPRKRSSASPKVKTPKPEPRLVEHVHFGRGKVLGVRQLDNGDHAATVRFSDGTERVLQLQQRFWLTDTATLIPVPPKPSRRKPLPVENGATA
jgi:hypothetical protein